MRISHQAFVSLAFGLAAAGASLFAPLPGGTPLEHVLNHAIAIDDLRLVLSIGALAFGISALIVAAGSFARMLPRIGRRVREARSAQSDGALLRSDWYAITAGSPLEHLAIVMPSPTHLSLAWGDEEEGDEFDRLSGRDAEIELRRLFWHWIARLQVWTATGVLFGVCAFSLVYRHLGLDEDELPAVLVLAAAGILLILVSAGVARLIVGRGIRAFMADLTGPASAKNKQVLLLTSKMEVDTADRNQRRLAFPPDPPRVLPETQPLASRAPASDHAPSADFGSEPSSSIRAELDAVLTRVLSSIERLETQQWTTSQDMAALHELVRGFGERPQAASLSTAEIEKQMVALREVVRGLGERPQPVSLATGEIEKQMVAMRELVRGLGEREQPASLAASEVEKQMMALQNRLDELVAQVQATQERVDHDLTAFGGEIRDSRQYHRQVIGELSVSFNRLEARLVPILRHVATTNRAMALLSQQTGRLEIQVNKFVGDLEQERASTANVVTPLRPAPNDVAPAERTELATELRQLLSELGDDTTDSPDTARAAP